MRVKDMIGKSFGRLTVIERAENTKRGQARWKCLCDCGNITIVNGYELRSFGIKSCGCYRKEFKKKNGLSQTALYRHWKSMKERCYNKKNPSYKWYGERGITVCEAWLADDGCKKFIDWALANGYRESLSLDRIDPNGNYEPNNCRWATEIEQHNNTRANTYYTIDGKTDTLANLCREYNKSYSKVWQRIKHGHYDIEMALKKP